ncbi:DUF4190 domain-containing protein [Streptomyces sp. NPDC051214]|uniref:DUF4190 domain-containing protein n=1 Tax=Streptomyces sp. NPDC051214 TaxID=3155282 RepID=UPI00341725CD
MSEGSAGPGGSEGRDPWAPPEDDAGRVPLEKRDPWAAPAAPPAAPSAAAGQGEPVPPPPIGPEGPGQLPYGYPGVPGGAPGQGPQGYPGYPGYPGHQGQGPPGYGWPAMPMAPSNGMGVAALVLGIVSAAVFCLWPLAIVLGILAIIFGAIGRGRARRGEATNPGQALAGIICGAAGIVLGVALLVVLIVVPDDVFEEDGAGPEGDSYSASAPVRT